MSEKIKKEDDLEVSVNVTKSQDGYTASALGIKFANNKDESGNFKGSVIKKKIQTVAQGKSFDDAKAKVLEDLVNLLGIGE